jgi:LCP family protein required for cell wall assembly
MPRNGAGALVASATVKRRRTWPQRLLIAFNIVLVVLCLTAAGGLAFYQRQFSDVPRIALGTALDSQTSSSEPQNFLMVGADNAEGLSEDDPVLIGRNVREMLTDTIMILRVDPNQEKAWLLSLPRDLWVNIAGGGKGRINEAVALGGPDLLIRTIKENFDIPINHYIQVNFAGFRSVVDSVGGVPIYFNYPARDTNSGLDVPEAGCRVLDSTQALAFSRSRYYEAFIDGRWQQDPTSDFGRIRRQQYFFRAAMERAIEKGARNPIELSNLVGVAQQYVVIDNNLTFDQVIDIGNRFNNFDPDDLQVYSAGDFATGGWAGAASVLFLNEAAAQPTFDVFRGINPIYDVLASVRVEVRNGTGRVGEGESVAADLTRRGFTVTGSVDDASFRNDTTVIKYAPGSVLAAIVVARYLDIDAPIEEDLTLATAENQVALVVGRDFTGVREEWRPLNEFAHLLPGAVPTDAEPPTSAVEGAPTTTEPDDSSRSILPEPPEGVEC